MFYSASYQPVFSRSKQKQIESRESVDNLYSFNSLSLSFSDEIKAAGRVSIRGDFPPKWRFASAGWRGKIVATSHTKCGYFGTRKVAVLAILSKFGPVTSLLLSKCIVT